MSHRTRLNAVNAQGLGEQPRILWLPDWSWKIAEANNLGEEGNLDDYRDRGITSQELTYEKSDNELYLRYRNQPQRLQSR